MGVSRLPDDDTPGPIRLLEAELDRVPPEELGPVAVTLSNVIPFLVRAFLEIFRAGGHGTVEITIEKHGREYWIFFGARPTILRRVRPRPDDKLDGLVDEEHDQRSSA